MQHIRWRAWLLLALIMAGNGLYVFRAEAHFSADQGDRLPLRQVAPIATEPALKLYRIPKATSRADRAAIAATGAQIEQVADGAVYVSVSAAQASRLTARGYRLEPLDLGPPDAAYHTYAEMVADVQSVAAAHPDIVQLSRIGKSYEQRDLLVAKVSDNVGTDEDEPEVLFIGQYHAREHLTVEMMLYMLHMLTGEYGAAGHEQITNLVNTREVWLLFSLNPDGGEYDWTHPLWRKNRQPNPGSTCIGIDLNRDHSYHWGGDNGGSSADPCDETYRGSAPAVAVEVAALEQFVNSRVIGGTQQIKATLSFHSYSELVLWPYGYTDDDLPSDMTSDDHDVFVAMGKAMAATNTYTAEQASDLYPVNGEYTDWAYGKHRIFAYTFEMYPTRANTAVGFYPPGSVITRETTRNRAAVLYLLDNAACPYAVVNKAAAHCTAASSASPRVWLPLVATGAKG